MFYHFKWREVSLDNNQRQKEHLKECAILEKQNEVLREKNNKLKATVKNFS
jgi:cell division protein FtsB